MAEHHEQGLTLSSIDPDGDYQKIVAAGATGFFVGAAYSIATNVWEQRLPATYFEAKLLAPEQSRSLGYYFGDIVKHGAIFASVGLAYSGTFTISKRLRETEDGWNYFWAAAATGALAGQRTHSGFGGFMFGTITFGVLYGVSLLDNTVSPLFKQKYMNDRS